jgi:membrane-associated phospholipid phosphatase
MNVKFCVILYFIINFLISHRMVYSQNFSEDISKNRPSQSFISTVTGDVWHVASAPFRISRYGALQLAAFTAFNVGMIYGMDEETDEAFALEGHQTILQPADELADLGDVYDAIGSKKMLLGLSTIMISGGIVFKNSHLLETTRLMIESFFITQTITYLSKGLFSRSRPYTDRGPHDFNFLKFSSEHPYRSMPSGHTSAVFSMMTVIAKRYNQWWITYPAYTLSVSVGLQRMDDRAHWSSDVFLGGAIGYWVASTLVNRYRNPHSNINLSPYISGNQIGLYVHF